MDAKQYTNPDDKLFSDREWARDEHGFKVEQSTSIQSRSTKKQTNKIIFRIEDAQLVYPDAKSETLKLEKWINQIWVTIRRKTGSIDGEHRIGKMVIGLIEKGKLDLEQTISAKLYSIEESESNYDSFSWILDIDKSGEYLFFCTAHTEKTTIPIRQLEAKIIILWK